MTEETCQGFPRSCANPATHTAKGYRFCLKCARAFAGYTPEPIRMSAQEIEQIAARRAYKAGLGASEWEACLLPHEMLDLMHAYKAERDALLLALAPFARFYETAKNTERGHGGRDTDIIYALNDVPITLGDLRRAAESIAADGRDAGE